MNKNLEHGSHGITSIRTVSNPTTPHASKSRALPLLQPKLQVILFRWLYQGNNNCIQNCFENMKGRDHLED